MRTDGGFSYLSLDGVTDDDIGEYEAVAESNLGQVGIYSDTKNLILVYYVLGG